MNYLQKEIFTLIQQDEQLTAQLLDEVNEGISLLDLQNEQQEWVQANLWKRLGIEQRTTEPLPLTSFTKPDNQIQWEKFFQVQISSKKINFEYDFCFVPQPNKEVHLRAAMRVFYDASGQPSRLLKVFREEAATQPTTSDASPLANDDLELEEIFNLSEELLSIANTEGYFIKLNTAWQDLLGYSVEKLNNEKFLDLVHPEDRPATQKAFQKLLQGEEKKQFTNRYRDANGKYYWIEWRSVLKNGLIYSVSKNITKQLTAQSEIAKQQAMLDNVGSTLPGMLLCYVLKPDGTDELVYLNKGVRDIYGITPEEAMKDINRIWSKVYPEDMPAFQKSIADSAAQLSTWQYTWRVKLGENTTKWLLGRGTPQKQEDGSVLWNTLILDITPRKKLEEALQQQNYLLKGIIESTQNAIFSVDTHYYYTSFNKVHQQAMLMLYEVEIAVGMNAIDCIKNAEDKAKAIEKLDRVLQGETLIEESVYGQDTHEQRYYQVAHNPIFDDQGAVTGVAFIAIDTTERKKAELQLLATNQRLQLLENFINQSQDAIQVSDEQGRMVYVNKEASQRLNISAEEVQTYQVMDFEPIFKNQIEWQKHVEELKQKEKLIIESENYSHKDKKSIPIEVTVAYRTIEGKGYVIAISRDISERKEAAKQLEIQKKYLETVVNYFPNGSISLVDENLNVLLTGGEGYKVHQIDPKKFIGKPLEKVFSPQVFEKVNQNLDTLGEGQAISFEIEALGRYYLNTIQDFFDEVSQIDAYILLSIDITDRKNYEAQILQKNKELQASEEELRLYNEELNHAKNILENQKTQLLLIFEAANLGTWDWDMETNHTLYNDQWAIMLGYDPTEIAPHADSFLALLHPDDVEKMQRMLAYQNEGRITAFKEEIRMKAKSGEWRWIQDTGKVIFDKEKKQSRRVIGIHQDITERKIYEQKILHANQELRASEEELKASEEELKAYIEELNEAKMTLEAQQEQLLLVFEAAKLGAWDWDMAENYTTYNKQWLKLMEYEEEDLASWELTDEDFFEMIHPEEKDKMIEVSYQLLAGAKERFQEEYRIKTLKGTWKWVLNTGKVIQKSTQGRPLRTIGVYQDISTRKESELALQKSKEEALKLTKQYQDILDSQTVYVLKTDLEGNYTYINKYFYQKFGYLGFQIGAPYLESIIAEDQQKYIETVEKCLAEPETPHEVILRKLDQEDNIKANKWEFRGVTDKTGQVQEILCVGFDITAQIESIEEIQRLLDISSTQNTKLKSFAYIVSHNVRSHAANFTGLLGLIKETENQQEKELYYEMLATCAKQLDETIYNLNEIISINENLAKPKDKRNLKAETLRTLDILAGEIINHQVAITINVPDDIEVVVIPAYLESVLLNLISNAIKYRNPQHSPTIEISAEKKTNTTCLYVKDNGLGIDLKRHQAKLFGMYKTFHNNPDARGFGLYITKTQIEAMGGKIEVESQVNVGSTFKVFFYDSN